VIKDQVLLADEVEDFDQQLHLSINKWKDSNVQQVEIYFDTNKCYLSETAEKHGFSYSYERSGTLVKMVRRITK